MLFSNNTLYFIKMKKILIIEDEQMIVEVLKTIFTNYGCECIQISNISVEEIVEYADKCDVILCDFMMPNVNGLDIYNALNEKDKRKFIVLTGGYINYEIEEFFKSQKVPVIYKPFDFKDLFNVINKFCGCKNEQ